MGERCPGPWIVPLVDRISIFPDPVLHALKDHFGLDSDCCIYSCYHRDYLVVVQGAISTLGILCRGGDSLGFDCHCARLSVHCTAVSNALLQPGCVYLLYPDISHPCGCWLLSNQWNQKSCTKSGITGCSMGTKRRCSYPMSFDIQTKNRYFSDFALLK